MRSYMLRIPNSAEKNCLKEKAKHTPCPEKRHKINKVADYQNIIVRKNYPAFDRHDFDPSQNR